MDQQDDHVDADAASIEWALRSIDNLQLDPAAIGELASIVSQAAGALGPLNSALLRRIAGHYLHDRERVAALRRDAAAWQDVVAQMLDFAAALSADPPDAAALATLGQQVSAAIQRDLDRYSFESSLDTWLALHTIAHFSHLWRQRAP